MIPRDLVERLKIEAEQTFFGNYIVDPLRGNQNDEAKRMEENRYHRLSCLDSWRRGTHL
jgi:hypothetical protein